MNMNPTSKLTLTDLSAKVKELNEKYLIDQFNTEAGKVLEDINFSTDKFNKMIVDPMAMIYKEEVEPEVLENTKESEKKFRKCIDEYNGLKKKYKYEMYLKEGVALRKKFLKERKSYLFNSIKIIEDEMTATVSRQTNTERLSFDFAQQHFLAQFLDKAIRKVSPTMLKMVYEDMNGEIKTILVKHQRVELHEDYINAPLIDRVVGKSLFDSFLLHSFYNSIEKKWQYVPVKLIISMEVKE